jgi:hypothetical protein
MFRSKLNMNPSNTIWDVKHIKWIWTADAREREIDDSSHADRLNTIWQGTCKDGESLDVQGSENISISNRNNIVLWIIPREYHLIFFEEIEISTFLPSKEFERSNALTLITRLDRPQFTILLRTQTVININTNTGIWNVKYIKWIWTSDAREREIDDSNQTDRLTKIWQGTCKDECSLDMEENENISISNINNMALRIILRKHNFDFRYRTGESWRSSVKRPGRPGALKSCCRNNVSFEELDVEWGNLKY